uniref:Cystatin domain-containing protein n=1 Tax=Poecilia mexicana TaxID=48701 RepID=A0A3B3X980_9TELE
MSKEVTYGGWSETGPANEEVSKIAEANTNRKFNEFKAIEYRSQVVGGMKYLIKVISEDFYDTMLFKTIEMADHVSVMYFPFSTNNMFISCQQRQM